MTPRSPLLVGLALVALGLVAFVAAIFVGSSGLDAGRVWAALVGDGSVAETAIVRQIRMPRALLAMAVGGGLAVVGVAMQALVRNPLAEPYVLCASGGASAGAALFYLGFVPPVIAKTVSMPLAAVIGSWLALVFVFVVAKDGPRLSTARLLLAGVAVSALLGSVTAFVTFASPEPDKLRAVLFWLLGSLSGAQWPGVLLPLGVAMGGAAVLWALARPLDLLATGEEPALALGVHVEALKRGLLALSAIVTGVLVASAGLVGFVGLIAPHAVRLAAGPGHRRLVPLAFGGGAVFLLFADLVARTLLDGQELPVGVVTALCGVPFFLLLLRSSDAERVV